MSSPQSMTTDQLLEVLQAAHAACANDAEHEGVHIVACELAVKLFPSYREYKDWLKRAENRDVAAGRPS